jgi:hypothetical protein
LAGMPWWTNAAAVTVGARRTTVSAAGSLGSAGDCWSWRRPRSASTPAPASVPAPWVGPVPAPAGAGTSAKTASSSGDVDFAPARSAVEGQASSMSPPGVGSWPAHRVPVCGGAVARVLRENGLRLMGMGGSCRCSAGRQWSECAGHSPVWPGRTFRVAGAGSGGCLTVTALRGWPAAEVAGGAGVVRKSFRTTPAGGSAVVGGQARAGTGFGVRA